MRRRKRRLAGFLAIGLAAQVSPCLGQDPNPSPEPGAHRPAVHVCDRRTLDATCFEFRPGEAFDSLEAIRSHCARMGLDGQKPVFRPNSRCPAAQRVGRCVDFQDPVERDRVFGTKHYYSGLVERWDWSVGGFAPTCRDLGGRVVVD